MDDEQKALVVREGPGGSQGLDVLNAHLKRGWRVQHLAPMGGSGTPEGTPFLATLVVIERSGQRAAEMVVEAEEEVDGFIDDVVDGDGPAVPIEDLDLEDPPSPS